MTQLKYNNEIKKTLGEPRRAFTLVELAVSSGIFAIMMTLVLGMVVMQSRFGISLGNYADMNEYSRKAVTRFEKDMRQVINIEPGYSETQVTINKVFPASVGSIVNGPMSVTKITYTYEPAATGGKLKRAEFDSTGKQLSSEFVMENLIACRFMYFDKNDTPDPTGTADIKKILLAATMRRSFANIANTDYLVSSVVTMRCRNNK